MSDVTIRALKPASATRVDGVLVRIYSGSTPVTQGTTGEGANADGERLFNLSAGSYTMRLSMSSSGYSVTSPQSFTVTGDPDDDIFIVRVSLFELPEAVDSRLCRCSGYFLTPAGLPAEGAIISLAYQTAPLLLGSAGVIQRKVVVTLDVEGYGQTDLVRGALYRATCEGLIDIEHEVQVPSEAAASLPDMLYLLASTVTFSPTSVSTSVGTDVEVTVLVQYRSGLELDMGDIASLPVYFEPSSESLAITVSGVLILRASAVGTFTVTAKRVDSESDGPVTSYPAASETLGSLVITVA